MNKSPQRYTFQKEAYINRIIEQGESIDTASSKSMLEYYDTFSEQREAKESEPSWKENNMEYDLRSTSWICDKVKSDDVYAQNLYAALCNNEFQCNDMMPILKDQKWSCSWRYAGGIIADMQEKGDYIDWYCSGIRNMEPDADELATWTLEQQKAFKDKQGYVAESIVTDEIRSDLKKLGWLVLDDINDNF